MDALAGTAVGDPGTHGPVGRAADFAEPYDDADHARRLADHGPIDDLARAEEWLVLQEPLEAGPRLWDALVPKEEPEHVQRRVIRLNVALCRLESWEARDVLAATFHDPSEEVGLRLADDLAALGDGMVLELLQRLASRTQSATVQDAVLGAVLRNLARLPEDRIVSVRGRGGRRSGAWWKAQVRDWLRKERRFRGEASISVHTRAYRSVVQNPRPCTNRATYVAKDLRQCGSCPPPLPFERANRLSAPFRSPDPCTACAALLYFAQAQAPRDSTTAPAAAVEGRVPSTRATRWSLISELRPPPRGTRCSRR